MKLQQEPVKEKEQVKNETVNREQGKRNAFTQDEVLRLL